jgi:hypothetical protein
LQAVERDAAQYRDALARKFRLLSKAATEFDAGDDDQVVVLAMILRVLLSDRLIDKVTPLDQLRFSDTAQHPEDPSTIRAYGYGITRILIYADEQSGGRIVAPLGDGYPDEGPTVLFDDWWSRDRVVYPTAGPFVTREYVVYEMANTDGVHIDPLVDVDYDALTRDSHGFAFNGVTVAGNVASAAVRQIAWETQQTLHRVLPEVCGPDFPTKSPCGPENSYWRVAALPEAREASPDSGKLSRQPDGSYLLDRDARIDLKDPFGSA